MKRKLFAIALLLICLSLIVGATYQYYAYQITTQTTNNVITMGGVTIELQEQQLVGGTWVPQRHRDLELIPDTVLRRTAAVKCLEAPVFTRVKYEIRIKNADGVHMRVSAEDINKMIVVSMDREDWIQKDGWWYYNRVLETGKTTEYLYDRIEFSGPHITNEFQNCTVEMILTAQAVPAANNGDGKDVFTAVGWPDGEGGN